MVPQNQRKDSFLDLQSLAILGSDITCTSLTLCWWHYLECPGWLSHCFIFSFQAQKAGITLCQWHSGLEKKSIIFCLQLSLQGSGCDLSCPAAPLPKVCPGHQEVQIPTAPPFPLLSCLSSPRASWENLTEPGSSFLTSPLTATSQAGSQNKQGVG